MHSPAKVAADLFRRSKPKVGNAYFCSVSFAEDVLWLEIPVVDAKCVAVVNGVEDLQEDLFDQSIVADVLLSAAPKRTTYSLVLGNHPKEIPFVAVVHDGKDKVTLFNDLVHGDDVGVAACKLVEG